jgi:hypothetical protein
MKKLFILLFLFPALLQAQNTNVRAVVSGDEVIYYRGSTPLNPNSNGYGVAQSDLPLGQNDIINLVYYVSNAGDDNSDGLSPSTSWAHHPWMSTWTGSVTLEAGDVVCMKRGDTWTIADPVAPYMTVGQSGTSGNPIITTAYGTGNQPNIKISTSTQQPVIYMNTKSFLIFDDLHIQHNTSVYNGEYDYSGYYIYNKSHDIIITRNEIDSVPNSAIIGYVDNYNITIGDITATTVATATDYSNNIHDYGYAGIILMGCDESTLDSNFKIYHNYIHESTRTNAGDNVYAISITATATSTAWPKDVFIRYNYVNKNQTWTAVSQHGGSYIYYQYNHIKGFGKSGISAGASSGVGALGTVCNHIYIDENTIEQTSGEYVTGITGSFISVGGEDTENLGSYIYIRDNVCFHTAKPTDNLFNGTTINCIDGAVITGNQYYNGSTNNCNYPALDISDNYIRKNITFTHNWIEEWGDAIHIDGVYIEENINIDNNIISNPTGSCIYASGEIDADADITFYNNTIVGGSGTTSLIYFATGSASGSTLLIKNNILGRTAAGALYYLRLDGTYSGTVTIDYNQYWNANENYFRLGGSARDWAYWTGTALYDVNSPNVGHGDADFDPLFKNVNGDYSEITDFDLQTTSPCINAGVDVAIDFLGTAPDIGYIEKR